MLKRLKRAEYLMQLSRQLSDVCKKEIQFFRGAQDGSDFLQKFVV